MCQNTAEGFAPEVLSVGTRVVFTNDYGVSFPNKVITRVETDAHGQKYYYSPSDSPWYPARRKNLTLQY